MDKERLSRIESPAPRLSLAEEQRLAFEQDQKRKVPRQGSLPFPGFLYRN
ncbi:hypothetical protein [Sphingomonas sp. LHG3406-1]|nr:hypothetical protein [Sphingomonas sp. LHG3406-1]